MHWRLWSVVIFILIHFHAKAQIQAGPMLGFVDMMEANIWLQTEAPAEVKIVYWKSSEPELVYGAPTLLTGAPTAYTATFTLGPLEPGTNYSYEVWVNDSKIDFSFPLQFTTHTVWKWRGDAPDFSFIFGSCFYVNEPVYDRPGKPYGQNFEILDQMIQQEADFMIWGGDNMYYREVDFNSGSGMYHRYTHTRSLPALQPLLASMPHYAIWDDHDFGSDNSDRSFRLKRKALEVFKNFWANPNYIFKNESVTGIFSWADCDFFLLDDRWWRSPNDRTATQGRVYLGDKQLEWLIDALSYSDATFKFIVNGGQIVNPVAIKENYANYPAERAYLLKTIEEEKIEGVVFLTGDRHHSCMQKLERPGNYPLYDITISPLTAGAGAPEVEEREAPFVEGTIVTNTQSFAKLNISGPIENRVLLISVFDHKGTQLWQQKIAARDLR